MKIHKRHAPIAIARRELSELLVNWCTQHKLSDAEYLMLLTEEIAQSLQWIAKEEIQACEDE